MDNSSIIDIIFNAADKNHDGSLDERELKIFLRQEVHFTEEEVKQVFAAFDDNKDGKINKEEFTMLLQQRETFKMEGALNPANEVDGDHYTSLRKGKETWDIVLFVHTL
mmetsp:Transcript_26523/g.42630  ORF Transcript_26523/g.42630 Transcript_26523/m.42630 type:complete len:109 (-) Transcript_26523:480-806(-)